MRLSECFLWTYLLLYHNCAPVVGSKPYQKMAEDFTCGAMRSCAERTAIGQVCGCDWSCEIHGDCCPDYTRPDDGSVPPPQDASVLYPSPVSCVDTRVDGGYLLVSTCPTHWKPDHISMACESDWYGISPAYTVPVASRKSHISYKNMFCAYCHDQTLYDITLWPFLVKCRVNKPSITFATMFVDAAGSIGVVSLESPVECDVRFDESTRRRCVVSALDCRGVDVRGDKSLMLARDMCNRYTDYTTAWRTVYKNSYCYLCHRSVDALDLECVETDDVLDKGRASLSRLSDFYDHADYKYHKDPTLSYKYLKEEEVACVSPRISYRMKCSLGGCPYGFVWDTAGERCEVEKVNPTFVWCSPGWEADESPIQHIGSPRRRSELDTQCANPTDYESRRVTAESGGDMMESLRAVLGQTNYKQLLGSMLIPYDRSMFGNCQSTTTAGTKTDNNAQLLAFMEQASSNLTWPWTVNLTVEHTDDGMGRGNVSVCELVPVCRIYQIPPDSKVGNDIPTMYFTKFKDWLYVCEDVFKYMESNEREERNQKLMEFLERAETIQVPTEDGGVRNKMGITVVVMLLIWVLP